nr:DNA-binding protein [uncultured Schaedlerella sp.]
MWNNVLYLTKDMVATFFSVDVRTIERYISKYAEELEQNGYMVLKGKNLQEFLEIYENNFATDINAGHKIRALSVFDFRAFLNMAMLLVESETAAELRRIILDIVIDTINQKAGGGTKYINQRDQDFIGAFLQEENYRREFTDALHDYVDMGNAKYGIYTDKIYQSIFKEKAKEYRQILKLTEKERIRDTFYSEVLTLISSYECGLAAMIKEQSELIGRKLDNWELSDLFDAFERLPMWKPLIISARTKMASRDMSLRDAFHYQLEEYIKPLEKSDYERFLGTVGDELERLMSENQDVLKRLKESE